jgi:hypothetical protein
VVKKLQREKILRGDGVSRSNIDNKLLGNLLVFKQLPLLTLCDDLQTLVSAYEVVFPER